MSSCNTAVQEGDAMGTEPGQTDVQMEGLDLFVQVLSAKGSLNVTITQTNSVLKSFKAQHRGPVHSHLSFSVCLLKELTLH